MFDARFRASLEGVTAPLGRELARRKVRADHLTLLGLALALGAGAELARGGFIAGAALLLASALPDLFDGPVARASGQASKRGEFLDSVADRVSDAAVLGGLSWYFIGPRPGLAALAVAAMGLSLLISYERAKAEALGYSAKGGLMERGERIGTLATGLVVPHLIVVALWLMVAAGAVTVVQRFVIVWRQASAPPARPAASAPAWRPGRVESRWREWREQVAARADDGQRGGWTWSSWRSGARGSAQAAADRRRARRVGTTGRSRGTGRNARADGGARLWGSGRGATGRWLAGRVPGSGPRGGGMSDGAG